MRRFACVLAVLLLSVPSLLARAEPAPDPPTPEPIEAPIEAPVEEPIVVPDDVPVVQARLVRPGRLGHRAVLEVSRFRPGAGRGDWSLQGDAIVFDAPGPEGRRELSTIRPDGTHERCLTCDRWLLRELSALDPTFHPSGELIAFVGQTLPRSRLPDPAILATPLGGVRSELWVVSRDGRDAWQLSRVGERGGQVLAPAFSHEGDLLAWSERVRNDLEPWGDWVLRVARFDLRRGLPRLGDVRSVAPAPPGFRLLSGFAPDDRALLFAAAPADADAEALEVLSAPIEPGRATPLTDDLAARDAGARPAPRGAAVVWASSRGLERPARLPYRSDLWVRRGLAPGPLVAVERLTFFNDPASDHALGEALVDDVAWSPTGDRLLVHVVWSAGTGETKVEEGLYMVLLDPESLPQ